jgi:hypothetical protein
MVWNKIKEKEFGGASIYYGEASTIVHLNLIKAIIFLWLEIQIAKIRGDMVSTIDVTIPF